MKLSDYDKIPKGNAYFERYKYFIGEHSCDEHKELTESELRRWSEKENPYLTCVFCSNGLLDIDALFCPSCNNYKGILPYIESWNGYGEEC